MPTTGTPFLNYLPVKTSTAAAWVDETPDGSRRVEPGNTRGNPLASVLVQYLLPDPAPASLEFTVAARDGTPVMSTTDLPPFTFLSGGLATPTGGNHFINGVSDLRDGVR